MIIDVNCAVNKLLQGDVVAIPTETVYGLAAVIQSPAAVNKIFSTKNRPFFDPLIVHVSNVEQAQKLVKKWSLAAMYLANEFWPGPLTLVLDKSDQIDDVISSGLSTVGIRMPRHKIALEIIKKTGPLAAPSANKFGRTSPTQANHVEQEYESTIAVVDGGDCEVGIESTILHIKNSTEPFEVSILRLGQVSQSQIEAVLNRHQLGFQFTERVEKQMAPGQMKHHYMPPYPLVVCDLNKKNDPHLIEQIQKLIMSSPDVVEGVQIVKPQNTISKLTEMKLPMDPALAARKLYSELRIQSQSHPECIIFYVDKIHKSSEWSAIMDRLNKAATVKIL